MNRITASEILELEKIQQEIEKLPPSCGSRDMLRLDLKFHRSIFRAMRNAQVAEFLDRILGNYLRFWQSIPVGSEPKGHFAETLDIIKAIKEKDEARLRTASISHIRRSYEGIIGTV